MDLQALQEKLENAVKLDQLENEVKLEKLVPEAHQDQEDVSY